MKIKSNPFWTQIGINEIQKSDNKKYSVRNNRDRILFPDEWIVFYDSLKKEHQFIFNLLLNTGARVNEVRHIKINDIDFDRNTIVLRVTKRVVNRPGVQKKGLRKIRVVKVSSKIIKQLKKIKKDYNLSQNDYLPMPSAVAIHLLLKRKLKAIGIPDWQMISTHNIRKTSETWLLSLDIDSLKVTKKFGHSKDVALQHYIQSDMFSLEDKILIKEILGDVV